MNSRSYRLVQAPATWRALTAVLAAVAALSGSYAYAGRSPAFIGQPATSLVVHRTPAVVMNTVLGLLGPLAQPASYLLALSIAIGAMALGIVACLEVEVRLDRQYVGLPLTVLLVSLGGWVTTGSWPSGLIAGIAAAMVVGVIEVAASTYPLSLRQDRSVSQQRRATLQAGFGVLTGGGLAYIVGRWRGPSMPLEYLGSEAGPPEAEQAMLDSAAEASFDLPDAPGLISETGSFYTVDINAIDPVVDRREWRLSVTGDVERERTIDYAELRSLPADRFYGTLRCVGEGLNDREMDTAVWTGVPAADILETVEPRSDHVVVHAVDGYWNTITREELERSTLVYGMNGQILPRQHGHPVRLFVPGNWGEVNVKWLSEIEFVEGDTDGYWEERGWEGTGEVSIVAKLWSVDRSGDGVTVGGHAFAGRSGVAAVEVSTDGGSTWTEAELSAPLEATDIWRQWRHTITTPGTHEIVVRARGGQGRLQSSTGSGPFPDGATGWVQETIEV